MSLSCAGVAGWRCAYPAYGMAVVASMRWNRRVALRLPGLPRHEP
ncbi:hypothetical protein [Leclercia adecarboxylata]